jgi:hypothetical protein
MVMALIVISLIALVVAPAGTMTGWRIAFL